jgi:hypothetical protein
LHSARDLFTRNPALFAVTTLTLQKEIFGIISEHLNTPQVISFKIVPIHYSYDGISDLRNSPLISTNTTCGVLTKGVLKEAVSRRRIW